MTLLDRLDRLMAAHNEKPADLARNADIPPNTIYGLYNKGYENMKLTTLFKICDYYGVSLDYLVKGAEGLSNETLMIASKIDALNDPHSLELIRAVVDIEVKRKNANASPPKP